MKIVFLSNFFNHHQQPLVEAMAKEPNVEVVFIETRQISAERLKLGWGQDEKPPYVKQSYLGEDAQKECLRLIDEADVAVWGGAPYELIKARLQKKKLTFLYSERMYKKGYEYRKLPYRFIRHYFRFYRYKNLHLLCASAYASSDFAKTGCFLKKAYKWGYFTAMKTYGDIDQLIKDKEQNSILWAGRFLSWKKPHTPIEVARRLKAEGYQFHLNIIGTGGLMERLEQMIEKNSLEDCVHLLGSMQPHQVREHMEKSEIFLFTSDKNEGWGAVCNESMNSACAVVASHAIGSVPFLLQDQENGLIYQSGNIDMLYEKVKYLLDHPEIRKQYSKAAYHTITTQWNPEEAAHRLLKLSEHLLSGEKGRAAQESGPCSIAQRLGDNWFKV